jgi:hypothetical protein
MRYKSASVGSVGWVQNIHKTFNAFTGAIKKGAEFLKIP